MLEKRKNPRYGSMSHVKIPGILEGKNLLKDISITGCRVACKSALNIKTGEEYQIEIEPERALHISKFQFQAECKWIQSIGDTTELGFDIISSPKGKQFQNYVDFLECLSYNSV